MKQIIFKIYCYLPFLPYILYHDYDLSKLKQYQIELYENINGELDCHEISTSLYNILMVKNEIGSNYFKSDFFYFIKDKKYNNKIGKFVSNISYKIKFEDSIINISNEIIKLFKKG